MKRFLAFLSDEADSPLLLVAAIALVIVAVLAVGCAPATAPPALDATICDRGSSCDLLGCDPDCDSFVGDAAPPSTTLMVCRGNLPSLSVRSASNGGCVSYEVSSTDRSAPDLLNRNDDDQFRHVYWMGGDPACVGTGKPIASGRDCAASDPDGQCAYVSEGYSIFALTGGSCSEHGVGLCEGPFCR